MDAALVTSQGIIPIDSKFPSENFRKMIDCPESNEKIKIRKLFIADVKKHIGDIAKKYILPAEGTVDYALMYVPAESVYYEIVNEPLLTAFANDSRVLPVSPLTFYAYMKAILMSFEGQRIQNQAKEILSVLTAIKKDFEKSDIERSVLQKHITNAFNQMNDFSRSFTSLGQKLDSTRLIGAAETAEKLLE